jgi:5-bromo-4-chloroindolyl phosphate hydrolysis protein
MQCGGRGGQAGARLQTWKELALNSKGGSNAIFILGLIGVILSSLFLIALSVILGIFYWYLPRAVFVVLILIMAAMLVLSLWGMVAGSRRKGLIQRMSRYCALFDPKTVLTLDEVASETGMPPQQIRKDLRNAQRHHLHFDVRCDFEGNALIKGHATWTQYLAAKEQRRKLDAEEKASEARMSDPDLAPIEAFRRDGNEMLGRIKAANIALPGEEISRKLEQLERTTGQIIRHVEQYPEKLPETRKLMNYHLPATLKIVEKYREYENLEFKTQSVLDAQKEIERMLDTVDAAFKRYLEKLMEFDTLDVSTDIEVLRQMFEKDGLSGSGFSENK